MKRSPLLIILGLTCSFASARIVELPNVDYLAPAATVHNDTIDYWVGGIRTPMDRSIEDVLRRIPGISVMPDGTIYYGSDPISHFYIEGMDLLGGDYTLATRHIRPEDIDTISVLERHQPIRALRGVEFCKAAALNLRIKAKRHLRPIGYLQGGAGANDAALGMLKGHGLLVEANRQQLGFLSAYMHQARTVRNNSAIETAPQLDTFKSLFTEDLFGEPSVPEQRVVDNQSVDASYNFIQKLKNDWQIKAKADYDGERKASEVNRKSELCDGAGAIWKDETNCSILRKNSGRIMIEAQRNAPKLYFLHTSTLTYTLKNNSYCIENTTTGNIHESLRMPLADYRGETMTIVNKGDNQYKGQVRFALTSAPRQQMSFGYDSLKVVEGCQIYKGISWALEASTAYQYAFNSAFYAGTSFLLHMKGDHLHSNYEMRDSASLSSFVSGFATRIIASPYVSFSHNSFLAKLNIPAVWYLSHFENDAATHRFHKPYVGLDLVVSYKWTPTLYAEVNAGMRREDGDVYDFMQTPFRTSYFETAIYGTGLPDSRKNWYSNIMLWYRNPIMGKSALVSLSYNRGENSMQRNEIVSDTESRFTTTMGKNSQRQFSAMLVATKNFYDQHLALKLNANYMFINQEYRRAELPFDVDILQQHYKLTASKAMFSKRLSIQFSASYGRLQSSFDFLGLANRNHTDTWTVNGKISLMPTKKWEFYTSFQNQWLNQEDWHWDKYWDVGMRWISGDHEVEITATNLLNVRHWTTQHYSSVDSYRYGYRLRPLEVACNYKYKF